MSFAQELRQQTAAVRLKHRKLGVRKALTAAQRTQAATVFHAQSDSIGASKKLLNTSHDAYKKVSGVKRAATEYWRTNTVCYPEPGIRLIRRDKLEAFEAKMLEFKAQLSQHVAELEAAYADLRLAAQGNLGTLYNPADYPATLSEEFDLAWEYPSIEPPQYLKDLNPALYEQEQQRIAARFEEAIHLTEQALTAELSEIVGHLADQLTGHTADGKPKVVRSESLNNIREFFTRFGEIGIRSNEQLESLARQASQLADGAEIKALRSDGNQRFELAARLAEVKNAVDGMLVVRKREIMLADEEETPVLEGSAA